MSRRDRRAMTKKNRAHGSASPAQRGFTPQPAAGPVQPPSLALRFFARLLLARWILTRVNHPDIVRVLLQVAHQVGRDDAIAILATKTNLVA